MDDGGQQAPFLAADSSYGACEEHSVRIARIGELPHGGKLSRDGSVHVTDEARGPQTRAAPSPGLTRLGRRCSTQQAT